MTDSKVQKLLLSGGDTSSVHKIPDYEYIHREMAKSGVTLSLLWNEYCEGCRLGGEIPFMYTQFCKYYRDFVSVSKATMHIDRKPGEQMEVDWAGQTAGIVDNITGDIIPVARGAGVYQKAMNQYKKVSLLIIDEWLLVSLQGSEARDFLEIVEARHKKGSTIFSSQFAPAGWHGKIGKSTLADAILNRIVHDSYTVFIDGDVSMRERKGIAGQA